MVQNVTNSGALAEGRIGAAAGYRSYVWLYVGSGVGAGIVLDGRPFYGRQGFSGEIGHCQVVQQGTASELAASPRSAFVADFTGAVVLTGTAHGAPDGLTHVQLDGGGAVTSTDRAAGQGRRRACQPKIAVVRSPWTQPVGQVRVGGRCAQSTGSPGGGNMIASQSPWRSQR